MRTLRLLYFGIDLRALAVLRVGLGLLLLFDLAKRVPDIGIWYVNSGLIPNHRVLWHPDPYQFSYLFALWTLPQLRVAFALIAAVYVCFLIGYRTRLFHVLSWLSLLSLQTRVSLLSNGGDYVFCTLMLWTAFMPLGARWSVDALRSGREPTSELFVSLSVFALRMQLFVIYLFNAWNKSGESWREGTAVYYMLQQARIVTALGVWVREHAPLSLLRALTYGTLVIEWAIALLIVLPSRNRWPRRIAIALIWGLHLNIALLANLGVFSPVMLVFSLCLLGSEDFGVRAPEPQQQQSLVPKGVVARLRELVVAVLIACASSQLVLENHALLGAFAHEQPEWLRAVIGYVRLNQGWSMFAPEAPVYDSWIVVDAVTTSGRHVDPFNHRASLVVDPTLRSVPPRLGQDVFFCDYTARIADAPEFHDPLHDWILNHGRRTRRPGDSVVRFNAYFISHRIPRPGEPGPTEQLVRVFLSGSRVP
ncbi:MAG TPA: HTTM domain-containing protein [Polyangiales bacterium]|nr:HTTM domain-containing protein [Polyangiales bacterium]